MINYDIFLNWAQSRFDFIKVTENEIKINSVFAEDQKHHLWCNTTKNAYHCWKTDNSGNLYDLVTKVDGCSYQEAMELLCVDNAIRQLEARVSKFFADKYEKQAVPPGLSLPENAFLVDSMSKDSHFRRKAEEYLASRKIRGFKFYICVGGRYHNRLIIPYYGHDGSLIYFNSRELIDGPSRYLGPDKRLGVGKGDVLWVSQWPEYGDKVYLTEGEFDAMTLSQCDFLAAACGGKMLHEKQIMMLYRHNHKAYRYYDICIAFDGDKSGRQELNKVGLKLLKRGVSRISFVFPPSGFKDWNAMLIGTSEQHIRDWVNKTEQPYTQDTWINYHEKEKEKPTRKAI